MSDRANKATERLVSGERMYISPYEITRQSPTPPSSVAPPQQMQPQNIMNAPGQQGAPNQEVFQNSGHPRQNPSQMYEALLRTNEVTARWLRGERMYSPPKEIGRQSQTQPSPMAPPQQMQLQNIMDAPGQQGAPNQEVFQNSGHPPQHPSQTNEASLRLETYTNRLEDIWLPRNLNPARPYRNSSPVRSRPAVTNQGQSGSGQHPVSSTNPRDFSLPVRRNPPRLSKDRSRERSAAARPKTSKHRVSRNYDEMKPESKKAGETKNPSLDKLMYGVAIDEALADQADEGANARGAEKTDHRHSDNENEGPHHDSRGRNV